MRQNMGKETGEFVDMSDSCNDCDEEGSGSTAEASEYESIEEFGNEDPDREEGDNQITVGPSGKETYTFDLNNLLIMNGHQIDQSELFCAINNKPIENEVRIERKNGELSEEFFLKRARKGCEKLLKEIWELPIEKVDIGPLAILPARSSFVLPRTLPPPAAKSETKWERFAKERGIAPKGKRSRKVYDEETDSWKFLTGYEKANKGSKSNDWPIMEVKEGDNPFDDPWEKSRDEKREKLNKNTENRLRNKERAGQLAKGVTTRTMKQMKKEVEAGKLGHKKGNVVPSGVPIDLQSNKTSKVNSSKRGRDLTKQALISTQRSTASLGKFDKLLEGEPERPKALRKRTYEAATDKRVTENESQKSLKVFEKVMNGGKQKELDIRKGKYARGETGYDYEYDDGLGPSTFKKRKGRAGAGKMKKMTKKRIV